MSSLVIPLDMSQIPEEERKQQKVKVAVNDGEKITSTVVKVGAKDEVKLDVDEKRSLTVAIGADSASDEDLFRLQTINVQVSPRQWQDQSRLVPSTDCHHAPLVAAMVTVVPRLRHQWAGGVCRWKPCAWRRGAGLRCGLLLVVVVDATGGARRGDRRRRALHHPLPLVLRLVALVVVAAATVAAR